MASLIDRPGRLKPWVRALAAILAALGLWSASHGPLDGSRLALAINILQYVVALALLVGAIFGNGLSSWPPRGGSTRGSRL